MKYLKNTHFLEPYINSVEDLVPITKLISIKAYRIRLDCWARQDGVLEDVGNGRIKMRVRLWSPNSSKTRHVPIRWYYLFDTLAHELAHLKEWEHTPRHYRLQSELMRRFARVAEDHDIVDFEGFINIF